jgi:hypothetical protein
MHLTPIPSPTIALISTNRQQVLAARGVNDQGHSYSSNEENSDYMEPVCSSSCPLNLILSQFNRIIHYTPNFSQICSKTFTVPTLRLKAVLFQLNCTCTITVRVVCPRRSVLSFACREFLTLTYPPSKESNHPAE